MKHGDGSVMVALKNMHWTGICRNPEREEDRSKPGKGPFWRKKENTTKQSEVKGWRNIQMEIFHKCPRFLME